MLAAVALLVTGVPATSAAKKGGGKQKELEKKLPKKFQRSPYSLMSLSVGHPNSGWQLRAKKLRSNAHLKVRPRSQELAYGHPALVLMLRRSARDIARSVRGSKMFVGDLSKKYGGPLSGHRSHQSGRDADVAYYMLDKNGKPIRAKRFVTFGGDGKARDGSGLQFDDRRNWLLVQSWVRDKRAGISHVFTSRALRKRLLAYAQKHKAYRKYHAEAAKLLKQPKRASAHADHFHVRISCPKRQSEICHEESR